MASEIKDTVNSNSLEDNDVNTNDSTENKLDVVEDNKTENIKNKNDDSNNNENTTTETNNEKPKEDEKEDTNDNKENSTNDSATKLEYQKQDDNNSSTTVLSNDDNTNSVAKSMEPVVVESSNVDINDSSNTMNRKIPIPISSIDNNNSPNQGSGPSFALIFSILALIVVGGAFYVYRKKVLKKRKDEENDKSLTMQQDTNDNANKSFVLSIHDDDKLDNKPDPDVSYTDLIKKDIKHRTIEIYQTDIIASPKLACLASPDLSRSPSRVSRLETSLSGNSPSRISRSDLDLNRSPSRVSGYDYDVASSKRHSRVSGYDYDVASSKRHSRVSGYDYDVASSKRHSRVSGYDYDVASSKRQDTEWKGGDSPRRSRKGSDVARNWVRVSRQSAELSKHLSRMSSQGEGCELRRGSSLLRSRCRNRSPSHSSNYSPSRSPNPEISSRIAKKFNPEIVHNPPKIKRDRSPTVTEFSIPKIDADCYSPSLDYINTYYNDQENDQENDPTVKNATDHSTSMNSRDLDGNTLYSNYTDKTDILSLSMINNNKESPEPATLSRIQNNINDIKLSPRFNSLNRSSN
ncbi:hypothetical protein BCR36DRAFT_416114 [Piromyces finnis]|uniref:Uncharacterized protein n=1 Tax=Piromyces finnis TaxID=1754191 RepID=A0A1Y1UWH3_9FUNG|nr:hypothetical protein BCR36DRAFT_416114 [Piromyces finnis]|eukprot:ORX42494.1 hypothetical protein BCR36DRAFT_416114 [Piromyces finnis]